VEEHVPGDVAVLGGPGIEAGEDAQTGGVGGKNVMVAADDVGAERPQGLNDQLNPAADRPVRRQGWLGSGARGPQGEVGQVVVFGFFQTERAGDCVNNCWAGRASLPRSSLV
jgi:hypothetical protein